MKNFIILLIIGWIFFIFSWFTSYILKGACLGLALGFLISSLIIQKREKNE